VQQDLVLTAQAGGLYSLSVDTDASKRLSSRIIAQELSKAFNSRGSAFITMLRAGRIKTSSDIIGMFTAATATILQNLRTLSYEVSPQSVSLVSYSSTDSTTIALQIAISGATGTVIETITVT